MTGIVPSPDEINATVARMEARLDASLAADAYRLMTAYRRVCVRFASDLPDPRDLALSRAAALMLVTQLGGGERPG